MFKNAIPLRLQKWRITADQLHEQLSRKRFHPCGSQDHESRGWISPIGNDQLVHQVNGQWLIALGIEKRLLPATVVNREVEERAEKLAFQQGHKPGRKQRQEIKEEVIQEFLPRAFTQQSKVCAWIDPARGWLVVDAPSQARAEDLLEVLRQSVDDLPLSLVHTEQSPAKAMAEWLADGDAPEAFTIDDDCALRSILEDRQEVIYRRGIQTDQVQDHIAAGKLPIALGLTYEDRLSFLLTEKLEIKRLEFTEAIHDSLESLNPEDAQAARDSEFFIMTEELSSMLGKLVGHLGDKNTQPAPV